LAGRARFQGRFSLALRCDLTPDRWAVGSHPTEHELDGLLVGNFGFSFSRFSEIFFVFTNQPV